MKLGCIVPEKAKLIGLLGLPLSGILSPRLFAYLLGQKGIDGAVVVMETQPEDLGSVLKTLPKIGFVGFSVTAPHKLEAMKYVDELDPMARRLGALNCIVVKPDGRLIGKNIDTYGFIEHLKATLVGFPFKKTPTVVVGAGGAARSSCAALLDEGVPEIRLVNRSPERANALAKFIGGPIKVVPWADREAALDGAGLLVNTTTQGMTPNPPLDLKLDRLSRTAAVYDIVRTPIDTPLLKAARSRGHPIVDGVGMVLHQAKLSCTEWFGFTPEITPATRTFVVEGRLP